MPLDQFLRVSFVRQRVCAFVECDVYSAYFMTKECLQQEYRRDENPELVSYFSIFLSVRLLSFKSQGHFDFDHRMDDDLRGFYVQSLTACSFLQTGAFLQTVINAVFAVACMFIFTFYCPAARLHSAALITILLELCACVSDLL